jgi:hypothetical protein
MEDAGDWVSSEVKRTFIKRLVEETGITEKHARDLLNLIGPNWSSLIREARNMERSREGGALPD